MNYLCFFRVFIDFRNRYNYESFYFTDSRVPVVQILLEVKNKIIILRVNSSRTIYND